MLKVPAARNACLALGVSLMLAVPAAADDCRFSLVGGATATPDGIVLTSDGVDPSSGVRIVPEHRLRLAELTHLSTDYNLTDDGAGLGSPRFSLGLDEDRNGSIDGYVHVYLGTPPNFDDPGEDVWENTGDLTDGGDLRYDLTQFGGPFYATYAEAVDALGSAYVREILLVVDAGSAEDDQTVLFDNIQVNDCEATAEDLIDTDEDGIPDVDDQYPDSDSRDFLDFNGALAGGETNIPNDVFENGYTLQDRINAAAANPRNHGQFVSAIARLTNDAVRAGIMTKADANRLKQLAAKSDVGKGTTKPGGGGKDKDQDKGGKGNKGGNKGGKGKGK